MNTLVTGAAGFVGSALLKRLSAEVQPGDELIAFDLGFNGVQQLENISYVSGRIDDPEDRGRLLDRKLDMVFHLATIAGVQQSDFQLGKRINLEATVALLDGLSEQPNPARFVYSSSVGIFGAPLPPVVTDATLPVPPWSYGTHKLVCELLITDYARVGLVDGIAIRFPGILARAEGSATMLSAFLSNVFYAARDRREFKLPLAPDDATWVMSLHRCLDNVLHAGEIPADELSGQRAWTLPALAVTMKQLIDGLAQVYGDHVRELITCEPNEQARALFKHPPLEAERATALGMVGDRDAVDLIHNVIAESPDLAPTS